MKAFRFTLQSLLDAREALEKVMETRLAAAIREFEKAQQKQRAMAERLKRDIAHIESLRGSRMAHHTVCSLLKHIECFQEAIAEQSRTVAEVEAKMETCRNDLHAAMRGRKSLERLLDGEHERWKEQQRRHEQKEMDEYARTSHAHRRAEGADSVRSERNNDQ